MLTGFRFCCSIKLTDMKLTTVITPNTSVWTTKLLEARESHKGDSSCYVGVLSTKQGSDPWYSVSCTRCLHIHAEEAAETRPQTILREGYFLSAALSPTLYWLNLGWMRLCHTA